MRVLTQLAVLIPSLVLYLALRRPWGTGSAPLSRASVASIAPALGIGLASCLYFFLLIAGLSARSVLRIDAGLWLIALLVFGVDGWRRSRRFVPGSAPQIPQVKTDRAALLMTAAGGIALAALAVTAFWLHRSLRLHGEWDAWAIWNLRARAILRGAPDWTSVFSNAIAWSNVDYPVLVPVTIARLWAYEGAETTLIPALVALTFFASTVATVSVLVGQTRGWVSGWLSGAVLVAPHTYVFQGSCQCADVPIAQFILIAVSCGAIARQTGKDGALLMVVAGSAAGLAAWTKNEGQLLLLILLLAIGTWPAGTRSRILYRFGVGAAVPLAALAWFKLQMAPSNYLFTGAAIAGLNDRLFDTGRWALIWTAVGERLPAWGELPGGALLILALAVLLTVRVDRRAIRQFGFGLAVIALMMTGYVFVYAITPQPLQWQISTSFDRLVTQLWPALVWAGFQLSGAGRREHELAATDSSTVQASFSGWSGLSGKTMIQRLLQARPAMPEVRLRRADVAMLGSGAIVVLAVLLTRTWGIHVDEILYFGYAIAEPLGDARIVGNHFALYVFNYGLYHLLRWPLGGLHPLILPVVYAGAAVFSVWRLAVALPLPAPRQYWLFALLLSSPFLLFNATQLMMETALLSLLSCVLAIALASGQQAFQWRRAAWLAGFAALTALVKETAIPALVVLALAFWPMLGRHSWLVIAGAIGGIIANQVVLASIDAPSASYGGLTQLMTAVTNPSAGQLLAFSSVWAFFAGLPALGAVLGWRERRDRLGLSLMLLAWLSAAGAIVVQLATKPTLPFPRYAYPLIWVGLAGGAIGCALSTKRWLAPLLLVVQLPWATALWPGVFPTIAYWPSHVTLEAFQNGGTILSGVPVHGWVAVSSQAREQLCVYLPRESPGTAQAQPWFRYVARQVQFFDAPQSSEFQQCPGAKAVFDRRFDVDACALNPCSSSDYRLRSCLPQHVGFYSPRVGDVRTRVCLP